MFEIFMYPIALYIDLRTATIGIARVDVRARASTQANTLILWQVKVSNFHFIVICSADNAFEPWPIGSPRWQNKFLQTSDRNPTNSNELTEKPATQHHSARLRGSYDHTSANTAYLSMSRRFSLILRATSLYLLHIHPIIAWLTGRPGVAVAFRSVGKAVL
jgi:hypothetical protein